MAVTYQVNIVQPGGQLIDVVDEPDNLNLARKVNNVGSFSVDLPYKFWKYMGRDTQFEFLRTVDGGQTLIEGNVRWLARRFERTRIGWPFTVIGFDSMHLLKRMIVNFAVGSSQAEKSGLADQTIKAIGTENLVYNGAATPPRGFKNFQIQQFTGQGASLPTKSFSRRVLLDVFQELAQASWEAGVYLAFDVVLLSGGVLELQTFAGVRGVDRREGIANRPLILSEDDGTMTDIRRIDDYQDEASVIYAGGQQTGASRLIGLAYDSDRIAAVPNNLNFIERFTDARNTSTQPSLNSEAAAGLAAGKPKRTLEGTLQNTEQTRYGVHYGLGDMATAKFDNESFPVRIDAVAINWSAKQETIVTNLQGEL